MKTNGERPYEPENITNFKDIQRLVDGDFESYTILVHNGIRYGICVNENGRNLKLPVNRQVGKFIPDFGTIFGDAVIVAARESDGKKTDMGDLRFNQMKTKAAVFIKQQRNNQEEMFKEMERMGAKIIHM